LSIFLPKMQCDKLQAGCVQVLVDCAIHAAKSTYPIPEPFAYLTGNETVHNDILANKLLGLTKLGYPICTRGSLCMDHSFQRLLSNAEHCPATPGLSAIVQALSKQNRKQQALLSLALPTSKPPSRHLSRHYLRCSS
jgi:hypothetical protein